jgi:hypothetical protein
MLAVLYLLAHVSGDIDYVLNLAGNRVCIPSYEPFLSSSVSARVGQLTSVTMRAHLKSKRVVEEVCCNTRCAIIVI